MEDYENLYAEYKYDLEELMSFVDVLLAAAENEAYELTHKDIEHNIEILHDKLTNLHNKMELLHEKLIIAN